MSLENGRMVGWVPGYPRDKLSPVAAREKLHSLGMKGEIKYNEGMHAYEYCEIPSLEVRKNLERHWPGFEWKTFTFVGKTEYMDEERAYPNYIPYELMTLRERIIDEADNLLELIDINFANFYMYISEKGKKNSLQTIRDRLFCSKILVKALTGKEREEIDPLTVRKHGKLYCIRVLLKILTGRWIIR